MFNKNFDRNSTWIKEVNLPLCMDCTSSNAHLSSVADFAYSIFRSGLEIFKINDVITCQSSNRNVCRILCPCILNNSCHNILIGQPSFLMSDLEYSADYSNKSFHYYILLCLFAILCNSPQSMIFIAIRNNCKPS